jgi:hypothetical protein
VNLFATLYRSPPQRSFLPPGRVPARRRPVPRRRPVLYRVPKPTRRAIAPLEKRRALPTRRSPAPVFTDIGTVGTVKQRDDASAKVRELEKVAAFIPAVGKPIATALEIAADVIDSFTAILSSGNAAGLSPQQLAAIDAGIKLRGVGAAGDILATVEGRAGTKQLFAPDEPGAYVTVGGVGHGGPGRARRAWLEE